MPMRCIRSTKPTPTAWTRTSASPDFGRRLGRLANLEDFGRTVPPYDHGSHSIPPMEAVDDASRNTGDVGGRTESADAKYSACPRSAHLRLRPTGRSAPPPKPN